MPTAYIARCIQALLHLHNITLLLVVYMFGVGNTSEAADKWIETSLSNMSHNPFWSSFIVSVYFAASSWPSILPTTGFLFSNSLLCTGWGLCNTAALSLQCPCDCERIVTAKQLVLRSLRSPAVTPVAASQTMDYYSGAVEADSVPAAFCRDLAQSGWLKIHIKSIVNTWNTYKYK